MMPYPGETASKTGHLSIINNPDVQEFLKRCENVPKPEAEDFEQLIKDEPTIGSFNGDMPRYVLAIDGSSYEAPIDGRYPSRRIGYINIASIILDMDEYHSVKTADSRFIDPMAVARLTKETDTISMALPSSYVTPEGADSVKDGFRSSILQYFMSENTKLGGDTLYTTLIELLRYREDVVQYGGVTSALVSKCGNSDCSRSIKDPIPIPVATGCSKCPDCGTRVYVTDTLRVHEVFAENGSNIQALNRLMSAVEHILAAHYLRVLWKSSKHQLASFCILVDGPLAIFGEAAPFHKSMMKLLDDIRTDLNSQGLDEPVIMGLTKTGRLQEHFAEIDHLIPAGLVFSVSDQYRYTFVEPTKEGVGNNFGQDTYYGHDFFIKTYQNHRFIMGLAYPERDKPKGTFQELKAKSSNYPTMGRALKVLSALETDLFGEAMIPVVLAHRHASISLKPGGKVLDIMSAKAMPR